MVDKNKCENGEAYYTDLVFYVEFYKMWEKRHSDDDVDSDLIDKALYVSNDLSNDRSEEQSDGNT